MWSAAFSLDGTRVVTTSHGGTARIWDAVTSKLLAPPFGHQGSVWTAAFSLDSTHVATASVRTSRWDGVTIKLAAPPLMFQRSVWSAAFSPDATRVVTASDDHTARIWEVRLDETRHPSGLRWLREVHSYSAAACTYYARLSHSESNEGMRS